jgi:hypothetical protein
MVVVALNFTFIERKMANPNIAGIDTLRGYSSTRQSVDVDPSDLLVNDAGSNEVLKVNTISISNVDPTNSHDVSVEFVRNNVAYKIVSTVSIPVDSTLNVIVKDYGFYLLEGDKLRVFGSSAGILNATCSYEQISDLDVPVRSDEYELPILFDTFSNQTVLLLNGNGTNGAQNNTFVDSSPNNFTITRNGNTTQGTFTPFSQPVGGWSNFFNGTTGDLSVPTTLVNNIGTNSLTIEAWIYPTVASTTREIFGALDSQNSGSITNAFLLEITSSNTLRFRCGAADQNLVSSDTIPINTWSHVAATRNGNILKIFINGTEVGSFTGTTSNLTGMVVANIGALAFSTKERFFPGYISNVRVLNGTALYTSNFTPPTAPLTAISGTSILTCQDNRFLDRSSNNFAITPNGDVRVTPFSPFAPTAAYSPSVNGGSAYLDGTGDYFTVANNSAIQLDSSDFTVEYYIYLQTQIPAGTTSIIEKGGTSNSNLEYTFSLRNDSGVYRLRINYSTNGSTGTFINFDTPINLTTGSWHHIAYTRVGTTIQGWFNGQSVGTLSYPATLFSGSAQAFIVANPNGVQSPNGYFSNFRIVKGTALYTTNFTPPTAPLTAITNTSLLLNFTNGGIIDNTGKNNLETVGNAQTETAIKKFGTGALEFDGTGDYLQGPYTPDIDLLTGSFTIEGWIYPTVNKSTGMRIFSTGGGTVGWNSTTGIHVLVQIALNPYILSLQISNNTSSQINIQSTLNVPLNDWTYIAVVYDASNGVGRVFVNGVVSSASATGVARPSTNPIFTVGTIPGEAGSSTTAFQGFIDDLRVTKGVARYTTLFSPPTQEFSLGSPIDIITDGLAIYLDSTNSTSYPGTGTTWFDLSGNARNFTWNTVSYTTGTPSYFSTSGTRCVGPASNSVGITNTSGYTIFLIMLQNSNASSAAFQFYKNNLTSSAGRGIFSHCTFSDGIIYFDQGGCCASDTRTSVSGGTTNTWNIYTFRRVTGSSTRNIFKNASILATNTNTAATLDLDSRNIDLGSAVDFGGNSSTWNARLGGFIVYNRGLSDSEVTDVYNTIRTRYGI